MLRPHKILYSCLFLILLLFIFNTMNFGEYQTTLLKGSVIALGSSNDADGKWSVPVVYDWNNDGKKDLLIGRNHIDEYDVNHGYVTYYENTGSDESPSFSSSVLLRTCDEECSPLSVEAFG